MCAWLGALLRVTAFMHWMTDALLGVLVGSLCGYCLPLLLFKEEEGGGAKGGGLTTDDQDYMRL